MRNYERKFHARCKGINDFEHTWAGVEFPPISDEPVTGIEAIRAFLNVIAITCSLAALNMQALMWWWDS